MCGITGILDKGLSPDDLRRAAKRMTDSVRHRGPDGYGVDVFSAPPLPHPVALGHARLAIIDLSPAGRQPMTNEDESIWITFNGEIFNFPALRAELEAAGHRFHSQTDTEVILHLYEDEGAGCFRRLNGIFALAILDLRRRALVLARDHLGVNPLYYHARPDRFLFGSEIKAILASCRYDVDVDWQAIHDYFTFLYVPCPATAFAGIRQLPPAHFLTLDLDTGEHRLQRYWQVERRPDVEQASFADLTAQARDLLADSVRGQLISDVPLGVFLSGGVDSTILAGLAREAAGSIDTFTVTFEDPSMAAYDESAAARAVSHHLGTNHHELPAPTPDPRGVLALAGHFDQPFANPTFYLTHLISQRAREEVTVALWGAGGDELYAGYPRYRAAQLARRLAWAPPGIWRMAGKPLGLLRDSYRSMQLRRAREFTAGLDADPVEQFTSWTYFLGESDKERLLHAGGGPPAPSARLLREALGRSRLGDGDNRFLHADVQTFLLDNLLEYTNKMSMAVALEPRVPFLDYRFVEFSLNVPFAYKLRGGRSKLLLRETFDDFFPESVARAPKRGFNAPLPHWMLRTFDAYFDTGSGSFPGAGRSWRDGVLDERFIQQRRALLREGRADTSHELFAIMIFDAWWNNHVGGAKGRAAEPAEPAQILLETGPNS